MTPPRRMTFTRPALWIAVPTFIVSLVVAASLSTGIVAAALVGLIGAAFVGAFAEARIAHILSSIGRIARGDHYTSLPNWSVTAPSSRSPAPRKPCAPY